MVGFPFIKPYTVHMQSSIKLATCLLLMIVIFNFFLLLQQILNTNLFQRKQT